MYPGIRTLSGIKLRRIEIIILENINTTVVESPIPAPLIADVVTARVGHIPKIYTLGRTRSRRLIVTFHEQKAKELYDDYRFFDPSVVYYPAKDVLFYQSDIRGNLLTAERISALRAIQGMLRRSWLRPLRLWHL